LNTRQPPRIATRLLTQLVCLERRDALVGDLIEQYRNGRSGFWYWRQALTALAVTAWSEMRRSPAMAIRVIVFGYVLSEFLMYSAGALIMHFIPNTGLMFALLSAFLCAVVAGWIIERTHSPSLLIIFVASIWVVSVILFGVYAWLPFMDRMPTAILVFYVTLDFLVVPVGVLIGGLCGSHRRSSESVPPVTHHNPATGTP